MVHKQARQRKTIIGLIILFIILVVATIMLLFRVYDLKKQPNDDKGSAEQNSAITEVESINEPETLPPETPTLPEKVNFQPIIDTWVAQTGGDKSVLVYDLDRGEMVGEYNPSEEYNTASIYKLFVIYEGYRRLQSGEWDGSVMAGSTGYTILECLDLAIRESHSPCAETIWNMIGYDELDDIVDEQYGISESKISNLVSNPGDILKMMKIYYEHTDITDDSLLGIMKDSFLHQPATEYDWRQGLPSGFSDGVNVYNKVGWDWNGAFWNVYHDAAIVEFPEENRHFIVVVMTSQVPFQKISELGSMIEDTFRASV